MRYLVTGAQGFIGRYLCAELLARDGDVEVMGLGRSPRSPFFTHSVSVSNHSQPAPLPAALTDAANDKRYHYHSGDICDIADTTLALREFKPDVIMHLASGLRADAIDHLVRTNIQGTVSLLEAVLAAKIGKPRVVLGSSGGVYGVPQQLPISEVHATKPIDYYSMTKLAAEQAAHVFAHRYQLPVITARIFNVVGPGQEERHVCGRFASQIVSIEQGNEATLEVGNLSPTRDFIDARDVASALALLATHAPAGEIFNVASGIETSVQQVLNTLVAQAEVPVEVCSNEGRAADIARHVGDISHLKRLGWQPQIRLQKSLSDLLSWYRHFVRVPVQP
jgi:GDP-4-dehydro-6-deoxy-D-mannose reductase